MSPKYLQWFGKFRKRKPKEGNAQYTLPLVNIPSTDEFDPKRDYEALAERVEVLERTYRVSQNPMEKLECPTEILVALPTVVRKTIDGVIFNYEHDFADFCFLGMRKTLIDSIRIRFQMDKEENLLYDREGNAYNLPKWVKLAKQRTYISANMAKDLTGRVKIFGDAANHDYMANLQKEEVSVVFTILRIALSRMFYSK
jgi:hypothetical protein